MVKSKRIEKDIPSNANPEKGYKEWLYQSSKEHYQGQRGPVTKGSSY